MAAGAQSAKPRTVCRGRTKVKSGCRTCKVRKVKCDESRPACRRCVSTGRVCDGYGIWGGGGGGGGGGSSYHGRQDHKSTKDVVSVPPRRPAAYLAVVAGTTTEEMRYFEWFKHRTVKKIPGFFVLRFWDKLVLQAGADEPAVWNALLTLSSVQSRETYDGNGRGGGGNGHGLDEKERFTLQHYSAAIRHVQRHFSSRDRASVRIALITCVVFVCLELLRGHFRSALAHLENGVKVLGWLHSSSCVAHNRDVRDVRTTSSSSLKPHDSTDIWITEAFSRVRLQVELFRHTYSHSCLTIPCVTRSEPLPSLFASTYEAWDQLQKLLIEIFHLTEEEEEENSRRLQSLGTSIGLSHLLVQRRQRIREEVLKWHSTFEASRQSMQGHSELLCCELLSIWYAMTSIMADACLRQDNESVFDAYTSRFLSIVAQAVSLRNVKIGVSDRPARHLPAHHMDMSGSIVDVGWIPPLYYTALKCRVHRVRLHALKLLASGSHREGIWDSKAAAGVARRVICIEEGDFYRNMGVVDDFSSFTLPETHDLSLLPVVPHVRRIREVKPVLPDNPADDVLLFYRLGDANAEWESSRIPIQNHFGCL